MRAILDRTGICSYNAQAIAFDVPLGGCMSMCLGLAFSEPAGTALEATSYLQQRPLTKKFLKLLEVV